VSDYAAFVREKFTAHVPSGIKDGFSLPGSMFGHQSALTAWALRRGRAAIFADTGLGKMLMELAWADAVRRHTGMPVMIHTPLAVAAQIAKEGAKFGIEATVVREAHEVTPGINITNYDRLHKFDTSIFGGIVLDESGCIKHHDAKTFRSLTEAYKHTPFKLPATATPAPNDWTELGTHAEFLGICTRAEMLAEFFTHDGGDTSVWRLKGHARAIFWRWVASWGAMIRKPSDLGFDDGAYNLPPLNLHEHTVESSAPLNGMLFAMEAQTLSERRDARRASMSERVAACAAIVNGQANEPWVVWCDLNDEGDALTAAINGAVQIAGKDSTEVKEQRLQDFVEGRTRVLVSKPSICGWGLNWQHSARMAFVGVTDSFESYYQAVRRCWRFGQKRPVDVHLFSSSQEGAVAANLRRKERDAKEMAESLSAETAGAVLASVIGEAKRETNSHNATKRVAVPSFLVETA
jgi:superfamily II DNA or RNA helicase